MSEATDGQRPRIPLSPPSTNRKSILPPFEPGRSSSSFSTPLPSSSSSSSDMSTDGGGGGRLQQQQLESGYSSNNKAATSSSSGDDEDVGGARRRGNIGRFPPPGGGGVGKAGKGAGDGASYSFGTGGVAAALRSNQGILPRKDRSNREADEDSSHPSSAGASSASAPAPIGVCEAARNELVSSTPPSERDAVDLLKLSFLLQTTDSPSGDTSCLPTTASQELCRELKESLRVRSILGSCISHSRHGLNCDCDRQKKPVAAGILGQDLHSADSKRLPASKTCTAGPLLSDILLNLVQEGLLHSLLPYVASDKTCPENSNLSQPTGNAAASSSAASTTSGAPTDAAGDLDSRTSSSDVLTESGRGGKRKLLGPLGVGGGGAEASSGRGGLDGRQLDIGGGDKGEGNSRPGMKSREVTIHVCDDNRNERRDFTCPQELLLEQMGYFRDITAGQSLEDVDISVHCDVNIFEWLMLWIKNSEDRDHADGIEEGDGEEQQKAVETSSKEKKPVLLPSNVMSILVSASFLKIHGLVDEALKYAHQNMGKILSVMHNFNCLGEPLFSKLAYLFKASEVEDLPDRRDRLQSRLYVKLIYALCEPLPQPEREIFYTAATLYRCRACGMLLTQPLSRLFPCSPLRARVSQRGEVVPQHRRDPAFSANDFIRALKQEVKSWRRVFWRLWGIVHPLFCSLCSSHFPAYLLAFCSFHPQDPEYPNIQFKNSTEPFGRFPCCDGAALRYQPVPAAAALGFFGGGGGGGGGGVGGGVGGNGASSTGSGNQPGAGFVVRKGCQSRDHRVKVRSEQETSIYRILMAHRDAICLSSTRKSGIKISCDINSITLPRPPHTNQQGGQQQQQQSPGVLYGDFLRQQQVLLMPGRRKRSLVKRSFWDVAIRANPMMQQASGLKKATSTSSLCASTFGSSALSPSSHPTGPPTLNSLVQPVKFKLAARRWRNFTYGRLKRAPKMPIKQQQSSESSSAASTEDLSEDSSSSLDDDDDEEAAGLEYEMDSKDLCIEIKLAKDQHGGEKGKSGGSHGSYGGGGGGGGKIFPTSASATHLSPGDTFGGTNGGGAGTSSLSQAKKAALDQEAAARNWMRWDNERSTRANQDHQRELECSAFRTMAKLFRYRQQAHKPPASPFRSSGLSGGDSCMNPLLANSHHHQYSSGAIPASSSSHNLMVGCGRGGNGWSAASGLAGSGLTSSASVPSLTALAAGGNMPGVSALTNVNTAVVAAAAAGNGSAPPGYASGGAFLRLEQDWRETHMAYLQHRGGSGGHHHAPRTATPSSLGVPRSSVHHHRPGSAASTKSARMGRMGR